MFSLERQFIMEMGPHDKNSYFDWEKPRPVVSVIEKIGVAESEVN